jgi:hypothetical protein
MNDYILNGRVHGTLAEQIGQGFDPGLYRPFLDSRGRPCVTLNKGQRETRKDSAGNLIVNSKGEPKFFPVTETVYVDDLPWNMRVSVHNATSLTKDEWIMLESRVIAAARPRLKAWADLAAASPYNFDGFGTLLLEHQTASDEGEAVVDMDMLAEEKNFDPKFNLEAVPLPITHAGWWLSKRRLEVSRRMGAPLDTMMAEMAGRRIAEKVEKTTIGVITGITYGRTADYGRAPTVYGFTNFPSRITKTNMTAPTGSNGTAVLSSWLALRDLLYAANHYGPFMVYVSNDWDQYLDNLFSTTEPSAGTLRSRLMEVVGITDIRRLDYLTNAFTVLMVEMDPMTARAITGMPLTTVQWEEQGGFLLKFRTLAIMVAQLFADFAGNCGLAHGTVSP